MRMAMALLLVLSRTQAKQFASKRMRVFFAAFTVGLVFTVAVAVAAASMAVTVAATSMAVSMHMRMVFNDLSTIEKR